MDTSPLSDIRMLNIFDLWFPFTLVSATFFEMDASFPNVVAVFYVTSSLLTDIYTHG